MHYFFPLRRGHFAAHFVSQVITIIFNFLLCMSTAMSADDWTPDLRVAIFPLEPNSPDNNYDIYSSERLNGSASSSSSSPDHQHRQNQHHHYHHHRNHHHDHHYHHYHLQKRRLYNDSADDNDLFCSMEEHRAQWTPFGNWSDCSDSCGGCGRRWRTRECRRGHSRCQCQGVEREEEACNLEVCIYPRKACCAGRRHTSMGGKFACESIGHGQTTTVAEYRN